MPKDLKLPYELDRFVSKYGIKLDPGIPNTMNVNGLVFLGIIARTLPENAVIVEAGALYGASSYVLAANAPQATVYSIDPWEHVEWMDGRVRDQFPFAPKLSVHAFRAYTHQLGNVIPVQGFSPGALQYDGEIDMFFEDATHSDPVFTLNMDRFTNQLKPGGVLCGDDFGNAFPHVRAGVLREYERWKRPPSGVRGLVWAFGKPGGPSLHERLGAAYEEIFPMTLDLSSGSSAITTGFAFAIKPEADLVRRVEHPDRFVLELRQDGTTLARSEHGVLEVPEGLMIDEVVARNEPGERPVVLDFVVRTAQNGFEWSRRTSQIGGSVRTPGQLSNLKASYRVV